MSQIILNLHMIHVWVRPVNQCNSIHIYGEDQRTKRRKTEKYVKNNNNNKICKDIKDSEVKLKTI